MRRDPTSGRYIALSNNATDVKACASARNVLVLCSSSDLRNWTIDATLLLTDEGFPETIAWRYTAFSYVDWQFDNDGRDIIYAMRTAYRGAVSWHNTNRITFKRLVDYAQHLTTAATKTDDSTFVGDMPTVAATMQFGWWLGTPIGNPAAFPETVFLSTLDLMGNQTDTMNVLMPFPGFTTQPDGSLAKESVLSAMAINSWLLPIRTRTQSGTRIVPMLALGSNATAHAAYANSLYITRAVELLTKYGFDGYSIDYEPHECATEDPSAPPPCPDEPLLLAQFIDKLASALHKVNATLSLCGDDRPYANDFNKAKHYPRYLAAGLDKVLQMGSYHAALQPVPTAEQVIDASLQVLTPGQLGVGITTLAKYGYTEQRLKQVLQHAREKGVTEVDVFLLSGGSNHGGVQWHNGTGPPSRYVPHSFTPYRLWRARP